MPRAAGATGPMDAASVRGVNGLPSCRIRGSVAAASASCSSAGEPCGVRVDWTPPRHGRLPALAGRVPRDIINQTYGRVAQLVRAADS